MDYFAEITALSGRKYISEAEALSVLAPNLVVFQNAEKNILARSREILQKISKSRLSLTQSLIAQYPLKTEQGYAIMSLAECLDRVADRGTAYELIDDKIRGMEWKRGENNSLVMKTVAHSLNLASKMGGNAVTYTALHSAFKALGREFILGDDVRAAIKNAKDLRKSGYLLSFDMLGEGARTDRQAREFLSAYKYAAHNTPAESGEIFENDSISIKISALHPRYELLKYEQLRVELLPRLREIIAIAKARNIAVIIDAEEAARLDLSLLLFAELYLDRSICYRGLGLAVQAYHKAAPHVLAFLRNLSGEMGIRIPVRLVKGAYWDYEIKRAQAEGLSDYPVYTNKDHTDLSYLACSKFMLDNPACFYPQFATHNVLTIASILEMKPQGEYEFQKLYGMGDEVYYEVMAAQKIKCRIYAPVGEQKDLLAYLIRRLLENGANNSFVNQLASARTDIEQVLRMPFRSAGAPVLKLPKNIYGNRHNSKGYDLGCLQQLIALKENLKPSAFSLAVADSEDGDCQQALTLAGKGFEKWNDRDVTERAAILDRIADVFEENFHALASLLIGEAKRNIGDSLSEIREAVDFCRYYAQEARRTMPVQKMAGITGEDNFYHLQGRGIFVCISPWNFPLSIFTGQIAAALVSGNSVIAKPAEQTPRIAKLAVEMMQAAGVPKDVLHLITGDGATIGARLTASADIAGICFTGSTATARIINKTIAGSNSRIIPFIAETGGQNCMIVDSTALVERVVDDMVISAFGSAGQRCSALRVAYVQDSIADELIEVLKGAIEALEVSSTLNISSDVGEVIDAEAKQNLERHIARMKKEAKFIFAASAAEHGNFVAPHLFEITSIRQLPEEIFGPVLHIIRYKNLDKVIEEINSTGYGLTFGVQTRIGNRVNLLANKIRAGNVYANRSMIGAVVESQPFGGHGLSGTGPKAGGPLYLQRFCVEKVVTINKTAIGGNLELL